MSVVTNGSVEIERSLRPADYENKKAKVSLSFAIEEGEDAAAVVERVAAMAHDRVMAMLRRPETVAPPVATFNGVPLVKDDESKKPYHGAMPPPAAAQEPTAAPNPPPAASQNTPATVPETAATTSAEAAPTITDAQLDTAVFDARGRNVTPEQIKGVILTFTGQPGVSMKALGQEQRPAFLAAIKALTSAAAPANAPLPY